jgi:hypothetical protein
MRKLPIDEIAIAHPDTGRAADEATVGRLVAGPAEPAAALRDS